jgi:hypothetical protein
MLINSPNISGSLTVTGNSVITGSLTVLGGINAAITGSATSASYVEYSNVANKPTLVSGSEQVSFNGIVDKPTLVSGSEQITYSGLSGIPSGIVSSSAQVGEYGIFATTSSNQFDGSQAITGSLTVTGQVVAQTLNVQQVTSSIVFSSGSNIFGNSLGNTQQFTGSVSVTGSLAVNGAGTFASSVQTLAQLKVGAGGILSDRMFEVTSTTFTSGATQYTAVFNPTFSTPTNLYGLYVGPVVTSATNRYNIYIEDGGGTVTNDYGIYQVKTTAKNYFGGSLGIGTATPTNGKLEVQQSATTAALWVQTGGTTSGYVIADFRTGTNLPALQILGNGTATFGSSVTATAGILSTTYNGGGTGMLHLTSNGTEGGGITFEKTSGTAQKYKMGNSGTAFFIYDETGAKQPFTLLNNGNVGIGDTAPQSRLQLNIIGSTLGLTGDAALRIAGGTFTTDQIVFGYSETGGYSPAVFGYIALTATGYQYGDLFFATRSVTTNTAPTERMRITSGGAMFNKAATAGHTAFIGAIGPGNVGDRYLHVRINTINQMMVWIKIFGYAYTVGNIEGLSGCYIDGGTGSVAQGFQTGSIVAQYQSSNFLEIVVDTISTGTGNRWGSISFLGGTDNITTIQPLEIIAYAWTSTTTRVY